MPTMGRILRTKLARDLLEHALHDMTAEYEQVRVEHALLDLQAAISKAEEEYERADPSWSSVLAPPRLQDLIDTDPLVPDANVLVLRVTNDGTYLWLVTPKSVR